jgi:hypothetical protein
MAKKSSTFHNNNVKFESIFQSENLEDFIFTFVFAKVENKMLTEINFLKLIIDTCDLYSYC